ncbi:Acetyltransferase (GNAT) family protein [Streptosporangium subroseum]|uniref:Acetyltransferase (GNAT) family protein n=1 Tax=Streptosporangium subroseum TaxID=106412 RepID=A0A239N5X0_9ACTN|nr:GNAT family N-acetyltransferase [Streptosporangium subroseum]SNT49873.1 Acetyltransferase (GNAT) family protein [Streptosporangium subroseum]
MGPEQHIVYRQAGPQDQEQIGAIDDSFTTDTVYEVAVGDERFALRAIVVDPPLVKTFPADESDGVSDDLHVEVAVDDGKICGFVVVGVEEWHHRLVIHQITVAPKHRGRGVGSMLMRRACAYGRRLGARTAWLETSNVNVPAVRAYRRMGFVLCGLDTTFYRGTASEGETALFMSKALDAG